MTSSPIIQRELLARSRARATYRLRSAVALLGLLICTHQLMVATFLTTPAALGHGVFNEVVAAAFLLCCGLALIASDSISAERREGTLELLFLTRVKTLDVLVGKFVSVGFTSLCALIAFVPALMLPVLAGGIAPDEALRICLALLVTLVFALGVGLCGSAAHRDRFKATFETVVIGLLLVLIPYMCHVLPFGSLLDKLCFFSPLTLLLAANDGYSASWSYPVYRVSSSYFWISFAAVSAVAWVLLAIAGRRLRRPAREDRVAAPSPSERRKQAERAVGLYRWEPGKEASPIQWVVFRHGGVSAGIWMIGAVGLACSRWMQFVLHPVWERGNPGFWLGALPFGIAGAFIGGGMIASVASRFFAGVRLTGELELLLTTPLGAATIVSEQWKVLKRFFVWPVLFLQLATLLPVLAVVLDSRRDSSWLPILFVLAMLNCVNTWLGTVALCWLGLRFGLKSRSRSGAIIWSVMLAQGTPWLLSVVLGSVPMLPDLLLLAFYCSVIAFTKRRLLQELAGTEPTPSKLSSELGFGSTELMMAK